MGRWRTDFNDPPRQVVADTPGSETFGRLVLRPNPRVLPHLGWTGVPPGGEITVPDEQDEHMQAGGWTRVQTTTAPPPAPAAPSAPAAAGGEGGSER